MSERNDILESYYRENRSKFVKKVSGRAQTPENAEDIVQNAFVKAMTYWGSYSPEHTDLDSWFGRILSNALKDFMRDERRYGTTDEFDEEMYEGVKMKNCDSDMVDKIRAEFNNKNAVNKRILELAFNHSYSPADIVQIMDVPNATVSQCLKRFKAEIRQKHGAVV